MTTNLDDLVAHRSTFPAPISVDFCGVRVYEVPPNGQGIAALMALQTIEAVLKGRPAAADGGAAGDPLASLNAGAVPGATSLSWTGGLDLAALLPGLEDADRAALMVPLTASDTVHMDKFKANQGNACTHPGVPPQLYPYTHTLTRTRAHYPLPR